MNRRQTAIEDTQQDWRELGFFYDLDESIHRWNIRGCRAGLSHFVEVLRMYAADPRNEGIPEHQHLGPYMYLTITTWTQRELTERGVIGTIHDIEEFANILSQKLGSAQVGDSFEISRDYVANATVIMVFTVEPDDFDPSSPDPMKWAERIEEK